MIPHSTLQAEGLTYAFYYPAIKPFEHYVPIMKKHKDDILDVRRAPARDAADSRCHDRGV